MLRMKLEALEHPTPEYLDIDNRQVFASTILWLEDQKIRAYPIEERVDLRKTNDLDVWEPAYLKYKKFLGMPELDTAQQEINWILNYAVRLEFLDSPDTYNGIDTKQTTMQDNKTKTALMKSNNIYDNMDFQHKDFIAGVRALASKLKVPHHPNHLIQLAAIARLVHERLSPAATVLAPVTGTPFPFEIGNDIVCEEDAELDYPVRILRLLQIHSLRELQTRINETIVSVQNITANPKTDTKLGQVGR